MVSGKVKRDRGIAVVRLGSAEEAAKSEVEIEGRTFRDIPGAPISATRIPESEHGLYDC